MHPILSLFLRLSLLPVVAVLAWSRLPAGQQAGAAPAPLHRLARPDSAATVVIGEFRTNGPGGSGNEFVELFNRTSIPIGLAGWQLQWSASCWSTVSTLWTFDSAAILPAGGHLLLASNRYEGPVAADVIYRLDLPDDGGLALFDAQGRVVDQVGMCASTAFLEGTPLPTLTGSLDRSYERLPGGPSGSCADTDNNFADFHMRAPSDPQNLASATLVCQLPPDTPFQTPTNTPGNSPTPTGTPTITPTPTATSSPTPTSSPTLTPVPSATFTPTPPPHLAISQVFGAGGNAGAPFTHDFIELFNRGEASVNLAGWTVQYAPAGSSSWSATPLSGVIAPGQYWLVAEASGSGCSGGPCGAQLPLPDASGNIGLNSTTGLVALVNTSIVLNVPCPVGPGILDLVGFGAGATCFEGQGPAPAGSTTRAVLRLGDGCLDQDNNLADFTSAPPLPRNSSSTWSCLVSFPPALLLPWMAH